ncbi:MAG: hypothetical protein NTY35_17575 [Planctomycetota bacterium]|nr:hypothetical protein [Planctomycetota bacterium]
MHTRPSSILVLVIPALALSVVARSAAAQGSTTVRASVDSNGAQGNGGVGQLDLSANGRYVVFTTSAPNLVPAGSAGQVLRHDLQTGETILVSAGPGGVPASTGCELPSISADGRWVAFTCGAANLGPVDTNNLRDVYLHDCETGANWIASGNPGLGPINSLSTNASISADGRFVAFQSPFTNLDPLDTNGMTDVYVYDRVAGTTQLVSITPSGVLGDLGAYGPSISADGRYVAFSTFSTTFHPADVNGLSDVYVKDRLTGTLTLVSARPDGIPGNGFSSRPSVSGNGRFVAFESNSTDLGPPDNPVYTTIDVFVRDVLAGTTTLIDRTIFNGPTTSQSERPRISSDGRFVAFDSENQNLVIGDANAARDVFLHDRARGVTLRVSLSNSDQEAAGSLLFSGNPAVSSDGTRVAFLSSASNLVAGDTNGFIDAYVRTSPTTVGTTFCAGDGTATTCPCGNFGALGSGCGNPVQTQGGHLFAIGSASVSNDTLVLRGEGMSTAYATYFQGTTQTNGGSGLVFGDGLVCAGGSVIRLGAKLSPGGVSGYPAAGDQPISVRGQIPGGGVTRTYQGWYRSSAPYCTPSTFNFTNGLLVSWQF